MTKKVQRGSYLEQGRAPAVGETVYGLVGLEHRVVRGRVESVTNIDDRGLGNTYCDVLAPNGRRYHLPVNTLYPHRPRRVERVDSFGPFTAWE